ncbi:hypothetical protein C1646_699102, partial [Rhizophagus diaphanus]
MYVINFKIAWRSNRNNPLCKIIHILAVPKWLLKNNFSRTRSSLHQKKKEPKKKMR